MGLDPDSPALPKLCINLQREALERTRMIDVDGVATEVPYQCAGLTEFCKYEDCVAGQKKNGSERPRAAPLDREDLATLRLFVDPDRRAALKGGKTRIHIAWGVAPKPRNECSKCMDAALTPGARAKHQKNRSKASNKCINFATTGCTGRASGSNRACLDCQEEKRVAKAPPTT